MLPRTSNTGQQPPPPPLSPPPTSSPPPQPSPPPLPLAPSYSYHDHHHLHHSRSSHLALIMFHVTCACLSFCPDCSPDPGHHPSSPSSSNRQTRLRSTLNAIAAMLPPLSAESRLARNLGMHVAGLANGSNLSRAFNNTGTCRGADSKGTAWGCRNDVWHSASKCAGRCH